MIDLSWPTGWANLISEILPHVGPLLLVAALLAWGVAAMDMADR